MNYVIYRWTSCAAWYWIATGRWAIWPSRYSVTADRVWIRCCSPRIPADPTQVIRLTRLPGPQLMLRGCSLTTYSANCHSNKPNCDFCILQLCHFGTSGRSLCTLTHVKVFRVCLHHLHLFGSWNFGHQLILWKKNCFNCSCAYQVSFLSLILFCKQGRDGKHLFFYLESIFCFISFK